MAVSITTIGYTGWTPHKTILTGESVRGKPGMQFLGFPGKLVAQLQTVIPTAFRAAGITLPARKIVFTCSPPIPAIANLHALSFPICVLLLALSDHIPTPKISRVFAGEVQPDGTLQSPQPLPSFLCAANKLDCTHLVLPAAKLEGTFEYLLHSIQVDSPDTLLDFCTHERTGAAHKSVQLITKQPEECDTPNFSDIHGLWHIKRALIIAVAGCHHTLLVGPPGVGKTHIARTAESLLPPLPPMEQTSLQTLYALSGRSFATQLAPFRSPNSRTNQSALIVDTKTAKPGEVCMAHTGILFLDELSEFSTQTLSSLRLPMETGKAQYEQNNYYPAEATVIAATNPCRCAHRTGGNKQSCVCDPANPPYRKRLGGALLDRFALHCQLSPAPASDLIAYQPDTKTTADIRAQITVARDLQKTRFQTQLWRANGWASAKYLFAHCLQDAETKDFFTLVTKKLNTSVRWQRQLLAISRTIADLEVSPTVRPEHIAEAMQYRPEIE